MSTKDNGIIEQNEKEANIFVAKAMRITAALLTLIMILNIVGIFIIDMKAMIVGYIIGMIILLIPTVLVNILKVEHPVLKYVFVTIAALFVAIMIITLNWHAIVIFIFAIGIASMYFSKAVNIYSVILSLVLFSIAQYVAFRLNLTEDRNQLNLYYTVIYCIVPRAMSLLAISAIFLSLNNRTTSMLKNLLDVDEQARMIDQVKRMKEKSLQVSDSLVKTVDTLSEVTENTTHNNKEISEKSNHAADGSSRTLMQLNEVGDNVSSISDNLSKLAQGMDEITSISEQVQGLTLNNEQQMGQALEGFVKISDSTNKSKEIIHDLEQKSEEIMKIIQVITSISSQTNLLALNASIESARAGEQGRGFAVVADEIRGLAEQTKDAIVDISGIIEQVVNNTMSAVNSMDENATFVVQGMDIIKAAEESSRQVTVATDEMSGKISEIDSVTKDVAAYSQRIVEIVKEVETISSNSLEQLQDVTKTSEEGLSDMEVLQNLVTSIHDMARELDEVVHEQA